MGFSSPLDVTALNDFVSDKSYIEGFAPSAADLVVFSALSGKAPCSKTHAHAARWYSHIAAIKDVKQFPGEKKDLSAYGPSTAAAASATKAADNEDDVDLFGSDEEEDPEVEALKAQRLAEYQAKKAAKPQVIAKSQIVLDVKPWDDTTDMKELEAGVRAISMDGLLWGISRLEPVGFGINKLRITCVVEDDKVSVDLLEEQITALADHVQSMDIHSFNKI